MPVVAQEGQERRIFERFSARFPARFKDSRNDYGTDVFLRDASASGARFVSSERFYLQDNISLEVELPGAKEPMTIHGKVVWSKPVNPTMWDIGLEFGDMKFMQIRRLFQFNESSL